MSYKFCLPDAAPSHSQFSTFRVRYSSAAWLIALVAVMLLLIIPSLLFSGFVNAPGERYVAKLEPPLSGPLVSAARNQSNRSRLSLSSEGPELCETGLLLYADLRRHVREALDIEDRYPQAGGVVDCSAAARNVEARSSARTSLLRAEGTTKRTCDASFFSSFCETPFAR